MSWLSDIFGGGDAYDDYAHNMENRANTFNPWIKNGLNNLQGFNQANDANFNNPTAEQNKIAQGFYPSAYEQQLMKGVQGQMNANAANTGMLGSQSANLNLGNQLTNMMGRFQQNYVNQGMSQYNRALMNKYLMSNQGLNALGNQNSMYQEGELGKVQGAKADQQGISNLLALAGMAAMFL